MPNCPAIESTAGQLTAKNLPTYYLRSTHTARTQNPLCSAGIRFRARMRACKLMMYYAQQTHECLKTKSRSKCCNRMASFCREAGTSSPPLPPLSTLQAQISSNLQYHLGGDLRPNKGLKEKEHAKRTCFF